MQVVAITSQKGGSGKTTLSGHVAVQAEMEGAGPVALIDTDPQGSLAKWWNARAADTPTFAQASVTELPRDLERLREAGTRLVIIDTPPAITTTIVEVVAVSDLVIIPIRPSPHDLRAAGATIKLVEFLKKPLVFAVNGATARARITTEAVLALSQHGTVAPSIIHHRTDFAASMIDGRTVMELPRASQSAAEIAHLWRYLGVRLRKAEDAVLPPAGQGAELQGPLAPAPAPAPESASESERPAPESGSEPAPAAGPAPVSDTPRLPGVAGGRN